MLISVGTLYLSLSTWLDLIGLSTQTDFWPIPKSRSLSDTSPDPTRLQGTTSRSRSQSVSPSDRTGLQGDNVLMPLDKKKWSLLAAKLKKDWPANADYYYFIQTSIKWMSKQPDLPHSIYCPRGDVNSGFFVSISSFPVYHVIIFAQKGFEKLLYEAVTRTKLIEWTEGIRFHPINSRMVSTVNEIIKTLERTKGLKVEWSIPGFSLFKSKEKCAAVEVRVPGGFYLNDITDSQVPLIHSLWHGRDPVNPEKTLKYVQAMVEFNGGLGLFSKKNDELVSWALQTEFGEIGVVHTIDTYRRRGYARVVVNAFSKELAKKQMDSFLYIAKDNVASKSLFTSLDWKVSQEDSYIQMKKLVNGH